MTSQVGIVAAPLTTLARWPVRRVVGVALATFASVLALSIGLQSLFTTMPAACGADCASVAQSRFAVVLGVPAIAWASALHAVLGLVTWGLVLSPRRHVVLVQSAQLGLVVMLLGGSATYLVIGLATDVRCKVCIAMHGLAVVASLGAAIMPRASSSSDASYLKRGAAIALALAAWVGLAWGLAQVSARGRLARAAPAASTEKWLAAVCEPTTCPAGARFGPESLPDDDASIVLATGAGPTLIAWLDLDCAACRADFKAEEPLLRERMRHGRATRLLLRAGARACDAQAKGNDARACEAPTAVVCAARHAGPEAALDLVAWELGAEPGYFTLSDRRQTLAGMSSLAARCLDSELALGPRGALAEQAEAARRIEARARDHAGCGTSDEPWWCFSATPGFAIVASSPLPPPPSAITSKPFATATGDLRREVLEHCLERTP